MKILSKEQVYEGDKLTVETQQISSTELMERAGIQIFNWLHTRLQGAQVPIHVFCGIGNNGGDGLVVARHLLNYGYNVHTYVVNCSTKRSKDFLNNYDRIKQVSKKWPTLLGCKEDFPTIEADDIIIDAVFGIGINRDVSEWVKQMFQYFRASKAFTLAIDIPSGLYTNQVPKDEDAVVWANYTLSFQSPKLVFFLPDTAKYTEEWEVLDIGIDRKFLVEIESEAELIGRNEVLPFYQPRKKYSNKGHFGHALIIGGSYGMIGSVNLASRATLVSGAGLVSTFIPKCGYHAMQSSFPEAMVMTDTDENILTKIEINFKPSVIGIGVGMGTNPKTIKAFEDFLKTNKSPLVVDADAINILSQKKTLIKFLPEGTVLTPHPKELERLIGAWKDDFDKLKKAKAFSKKYRLIIVIKGANTITVMENKLYVNTSGNPGMATGGTGDVLTGIITGLISQDYNPLVAAIFGVYLHGKSADIAVQDTGYESLIASHIIETLGEAYLDLFREPEKVLQEENTKQ